MPRLLQYLSLVFLILTGSWFFYYPENEEWTGYFRSSKLNTDAIIDSLCHTVDSLGEFAPIDRRYTSKLVSGLYYCESMFFRKHKNGGSIEFRNIDNFCDPPKSGLTII